MIESYFFIPGHHPKLSRKIDTIKADHLIIDLEDAVLKKNIQPSLNTMEGLNSKERLWIRPVVFDSNEKQFKTIETLIRQGFRNFIIPKLRNINQLKSFESFIGRSLIKELKTILLVENPDCLLNLNHIIEQSPINIEGIGFGSQDYCTETGMKHIPDYLRVPRFQIMNTAKAFRIKSIDIACMDSKAGEPFTNELKETFDMGFDGKFLIHPAQLDKLKEFSYYSKNEIIEANNILSEYTLLGKPAVFVYNNKAIEPPHIAKYLKIIKWSNTYEK